jgi:GT2 family glycosyltransferase
MSPSPSLTPPFPSPPAPPRLSVLVPLYNCLPLTQAMVASLRATLPPGLAHEILLVDDGSSDGTRKWLDSLGAPDARDDAPGTPFRVLRNERNLGFAVTNNRAAALARGELLALLNNDLVLLPGWLEPMLAAHLRLGPRAGLIGNVQLDARTGAVDHAGLELTPTGKPVHVRALPPPWRRWWQPVRPRPAVTGACLLVARTLWRQLGGFDEAFRNGGEDIDLCYRARAAGRINAVALRSVVRHHVSASPGRKARDEHNSHRLARRWPAALAADALRPWCRDTLARTFAVPAPAEYRLALAACAYLARLRSSPPAAATRGVAEGMQIELARWADLFGAPPLPRPPPPPVDTSPSL